MLRSYARLAALTYAVLLVLLLLTVLLTRIIGGEAVAQAYAGVAGNTDWTPFVGTSPQGIEYMLVPVGCFDMGDPDDANIDDGGRQCFEEPFWISRYEITNAQYQRCVDAGACAPSSCADSAGFNSPQQPVVCVDWFQAQAFAAWAGSRLPTEAAWEYAARGPDDLLFPWRGDVVFCDVVNFRGQGDGCPGTTAAVGTYSPAGDSWVGAADLAGNAWEWTATIYVDYPYDAADGREDVNDDSANRVLRGGSWGLNLNLARAAARGNSYPSFRHNYNGFRVVLAASAAGG